MKQIRGEQLAQGHCVVAGVRLETTTLRLPSKIHPATPCTTSLKLCAACGFIDVILSHLNCFAFKFQFCFIALILTLRLNRYIFRALHCPLLTFPQKNSDFAKIAVYFGWMRLNISKINSFVPFCNSCFCCVCRKRVIWSSEKLREQIFLRCIYLRKGFSIS